MQTLSDLRSQYSADYYERGVEMNISGYSNYRWIPELTVPMCMVLIDHLGIRRNQTVLDFGCAKGFVVRALTMLGRDATGVDISPYAIENADAAVADRCFLIDDLNAWTNGRSFDHAIAKDVLEHLPHDRVDATLAALAACAEQLVVVVPLGDTARYLIDAYERDVTHVIRQPAEWWRDRLAAHFDHVEWTHHLPGIKDNWYRVHPKGNAVFTARRRVAPAIELRRAG